MQSQIQCPVCTLYLHVGMSLHDHLDTHPKEQVIKALVNISFTQQQNDNDESDSKTFQCSRYEPIRDETLTTPLPTPQTTNTTKSVSPTKQADIERTPDRPTITAHSSPTSTRRQPQQSQQPQQHQQQQQQQHQQQPHQQQQQQQQLCPKVPPTQFFQIAKLVTKKPTPAKIITKSPKTPIAKKQLPSATKTIKPSPTKPKPTTTTKFIETENGNFIVEEVDGSIDTHLLDKYPFKTDSILNSTNTDVMQPNVLTAELAPSLNVTDINEDGSVYFESTADEYKDFEYSSYNYDELNADVQANSELTENYMDEEEQEQEQTEELDESDAMSISTINQTEYGDGIEMEQQQQQQQQQQPIQPILSQSTPLPQITLPTLSSGLKILSVVRLAPNDFYDGMVTTNRTSPRRMGKVLSLSDVLQESKSKITICDKTTAAKISSLKRTNEMTRDDYIENNKVQKLATSSPNSKFIYIDKIPQTFAENKLVEILPSTSKTHTTITRVPSVPAIATSVIRMASSAPKLAKLETIVVPPKKVPTPPPKLDVVEVQPKSKTKTKTFILDEDEDTMPSTEIALVETTETNFSSSILCPLNTSTDALMDKFTTILEDNEPISTLNSNESTSSAPELELSTQPKTPQIINDNILSVIPLETDETAPDLDVINERIQLLENCLQNFEDSSKEYVSPTPTDSKDDIKTEITVEALEIIDQHENVDDKTSGTNLLDNGINYGLSTFLGYNNDNALPTGDSFFSQKNPIPSTSSDRACTSKSVPTTSVIRLASPQRKSSEKMTLPTPSRPLVKTPYVKAPKKLVVKFKKPFIPVVEEEANLQAPEIGTAPTTIILNDSDDGGEHSVEEKKETVIGDVDSIANDEIINGMPILKDFTATSFSYLDEFPFSPFRQSYTPAPPTLHAAPSSSSSSTTTISTDSLHVNIIPLTTDEIDEKPNLIDIGKYESPSRPDSPQIINENQDTASECEMEIETEIKTNFCEIQSAAQLKELPPLPQLTPAPGVSVDPETNAFQLKNWIDIQSSSTPTKVTVTSEVPTTPTTPTLPASLIFSEINNKSDDKDDKEVIAALIACTSAAVGIETTTTSTTTTTTLDSPAVTSPAPESTNGTNSTSTTPPTQQPYSALNNYIATPGPSTRIDYGLNTFLDYNDGEAADDFYSGSGCVRLSPIGFAGQENYAWNQRLSPHYAAFHQEERTSYMDLDLCKNTNSYSGDRAMSTDSLNIRTDEKMPAKGEISEQESNGDIDGSWSYQIYQFQDNLPRYPSSYDTTVARESWSLSNDQNVFDNITVKKEPCQLVLSQFTALKPIADDQTILPPMEALAPIVAPKSKAARNKKYLCPHCPKTFKLLKDRSVHMVAEHNYEQKKSRCRIRIPCTTTSASGSGSNAATVTTTITSSMLPDGADTSISLAERLDPNGLIKSVPATATVTKRTTLVRRNQYLLSYNWNVLRQKLTSELNGEDVKLPILPVEANRYMCMVCHEVFAHIKTFDAHMSIHPAECYTCGRTFKHWVNFNVHLKRHLNIRDHECRHCHKRFVLRQNLLEHLNTHSGETPLKCKICNKRFGRYSNLIQHRNRHHLNIRPKEKDFICSCGEVFHTEAKIAWHRETHEKKPKCCPYCRERFMHRNSLSRHIRLSHTEKFSIYKSKTVECPECKKKFMKSSLNAHIASHTRKAEFSCTICNKQFSTKWNLKQHKWIHASRSSKPFKCNVCPKAFIREAEYTSHMNTHKSIKPYTCDYCGCQFARKYNWLRHTREHEKPKGFRCDDCGKVFHRAYYLTEHRRSHTGERPFECVICGKASTTKTNHNKHVKIHHARDPLTAEG